MKLCNSHTKYLHKSKHKITNTFYPPSHQPHKINYKLKFPILNVHKETHTKQYKKNLILPSEKP